MKIVLASRNQGKILELQKILAKSNLANKLEVIGLDSLATISDIEETGKTFQENALLKALNVAKQSKLLTLADDSGLEVEALNFAPGIYSARYALDLPKLPNESQDACNNRKLLQALGNNSNRKARFVCALALVEPFSLDSLILNGLWQGEILTSPRGTNGFGYDPLFLDPISGKSSAELTSEEKNQRSHRAKALAKLIEYLPDFLKFHLE